MRSRKLTKCGLNLFMKLSSEIPMFFLAAHTNNGTSNPGIFIETL